MRATRSATVHLVLEDTHPDGVDGDDVRAILERCARAALTWHPDTDPHVLLLLLAGALGVHDDGEPLPPPSSRALLLADLLGDTPAGDEAANKQVTACLTAAFAEIERAQLND
ncbi:hypothetical protein AB0M54_37275 [Actinoplanes sp. NPDC051470]|uniref:hypothetical protein n=1 Tax=Actinoplanes sp. NPDC051470 TaxID=3157224 RepID=UPI00343846AB